MRSSWIALVMIAAAGTANAQEKPNVVLMLADNIGYGDIGAYGAGEVRGMPTPRIDQLASEGLRLTQYLVEPACTPSRAALMTGRYSQRLGLSTVIIGGTPNTLQAGEVTLGELFKSQGYATAITGKWHLGASEQSWPTRQGFDEYRVGVLASTAEGTGLRSSNGGGSMVMITMALRSRCRHQPMSAAATNIAAGPIPPRPARNGTPAKGPWGGVNGSSGWISTVQRKRRSANRKNSRLYPPGGRGT